MKINQVEELTGVTKKNIRFYEEQGLLSPRRNLDNGYRVYGEEEVKVLRQIKFLRKLGVPIEEIRQMLQGTHTIGDGMRRHKITLEREHKNLESAISLCEELQTMDVPLAELDAEAMLEKMETMERSGASFQNQHKQDVRVHFVAPVVITVGLIGLMAALIALIVWAYLADPAAAPPIAIVAVFVLVCVGVCIGALLALAQRIAELTKGEMDDARKY